MSTHTMSTPRPNRQPPAALLLHEVVLDARRVDIRCEHGIITRISPVDRNTVLPDPTTVATSGTYDGTEDVVVIEGRARHVIPGLHDHHIHLLATDAARRSIRLGPPDVSNTADMTRALTEAAAELAPGEWIRAIGYHESVAGELDREALDALVGDVPVRVQHRSGSLWVLNSAALDALGCTELELRRTGRLFRRDAWLRDQLGSVPTPDLTALGRDLASLGVTGTTDMTPISDLADLEALAAATEAIPQHVMLTGGVELADTTFPTGVTRGPVKVMLSDHDLPTLDEIAEQIAVAHGAGRSAAVHCVTQAALVLALAAWDQVGVLNGDRIEHGSVILAELRDPIAAHGLRVVTQPNFVYERGDDYLREIDPAHHGDLYRAATLMARRIRLAAGTDAPFGEPDPFAAMHAAVNRRTRGGEVLGPPEHLTEHEALALFLSPPELPGDPPRQIREGAPADLVVLTRAIDDEHVPVSAADVEMTIIGGQIIYDHTTTNTAD